MNQLSQPFDLLIICYTTQRERDPFPVEPRASCKRLWHMSFRKLTSTNFPSTIKAILHQNERAPCYRYREIGIWQESFGELAQWNALYFHRFCFAVWDQLHRQMDLNLNSLSN